MCQDRKKENTMSEDLRELSDERTLEEVKGNEVAILYKHSTRCPTSWSAKRQVERFLDRSTGTPVYVVDVIQNRSLSMQIAEDLGVKHESPQAILLCSGEVKEHASHRHITVHLLNDWVTAAGR
jgi:bacillithiol system protein YtxJ